MELVLISLPFLAAVLIPFAGRVVPRPWTSWGVAAVMAGLFVWLLTLLERIGVGGPVIVSVPWVEALGLSLELYIDGLAAMFGLLITGIGAAVFTYAGFYMADDDRQLRFYALLSAFAGSMLGVVLSGNLLLLFICWEATSILSFLLIGFDGKNPDARRGSLMALVITGGGGLALLLGLVLTGVASGSFSMVDVLQAPLAEHPWAQAITLLLMIGGFTKSAQFPFHFWLPNGMTAPTPASTYLHSATMVKAGVYLFARFYPSLGDSALWTTGLTTIGLLTLIVGAVTAIRQRDLKGLLAYATVSWLGTLVFLLGLPHGEGYGPAMIGIIAHALYKSSLFMVAGAVDHATGTRNIDRLGGLARRMPEAAAVTVVAALSMCGVVPLLGFVAKEELLHAVLHTHNNVFLVGTMLAAALTVTAALIYAWDVFFRPAPLIAPAVPNIGKVVHGSHAPILEGSAEVEAPNAPASKDPPGSANEPGDHDHHHDHDHFHVLPRLMMLGPAVVAGLSLVAALFIDQMINPLLTLVGPDEVHLHLFAGFNEVFWLSMLALGIGIVIFLVRRWWLGWNVLPGLNATRAYDAAMGLMYRAGDAMLVTQGGKLNRYLVIMLGVVGVLLMLLATELVDGAPLRLTFNGSRDLLQAVLLLLAIGATLASILFKGHLLAALALGVTGYSVAGIFVLAPGPDIAMVQVLVETLAAVLVLIMLSRISERKRIQAAEALWGRGRSTVIRDFLVALLVGVGVAAFALAAVTNRPTRDSRLAQWYIDNAEQVGVHDIVGAIITDFRGTDTLVEISVFSMAALGVLTVLYLRRGRTEAQVPSLTRLASRIDTPLSRLAATLLLPVAALIALAHLLYAGDGPGDGFTAGVIGGISLSLWYQVFGYGVQRLRGLRAEFLISIGLALALANASLPLVFDLPFLAHNDFGDIALPAGLHFSSSTVFEIAIFLTVLGSVITILNAVTHPEGIEEL